MSEFNAVTLDGVGPVGSQNQEMRVLGKMNSLTDDQEKYVKGLRPRMEVPQHSVQPWEGLSLSCISWRIYFRTFLRA